MPSQETDHVSPTEVTPELGKEALGTWRPPRPYGGRLDKTGTYAMTAQGGEAVGKPGVVGVHTIQRLNLSTPWEGLRMTGQGFKPASGNPTVRHYRGASRNVRHGEIVNPPAIERAGTETPHLQRCALDFYPDHLLKIMLKANGRCGVPQGGVVSPLLSNIYLNEVDRMLERAKEATRYGEYTGIEYARFADDLVILIDAHPRHDWLLPAVEKRLREELAALQVEVNEEKSRIVDLGRGESFGFLGYDFRRIRSGRGVWRAQYTPKLKKRTALLQKLKEKFRRYRSQPVNRVIELINPILRGWVNYFAVGHSSECFRFIQNWVEKKVRRHMMKARKRQGFGWTRWSRQWLYDTLKLFNGYKVRRPQPKVAPAG
jgi:Reverse transcriptase (RNA-dependent DNA polymerase)/Group II intron, maturase-specific domain